MLDKFSGFDDSEDGINEDFEPEKVDLHQLFNPEFIQKHSEYSSIDEIFEKFDIPAGVEAYKTIPAEKLDDIISEITEFSSWSEMYSEAIQEFHGF